jgi:hypothetical protein
LHTNNCRATFFFEKSPTLGKKYNTLAAGAAAIEQRCKGKKTQTHTHTQDKRTFAKLISYPNFTSYWNQSESIIGKGKEELENEFEKEARNTTIDRSN